ncbi:outer membrane beta-barrel protein [Methylovorus menthalis]|uniref:OmpW/AlkL family protein n=1 Tax=Methylovorus menthalis TaxID=1002227 RepID=UPI001E56DE7A|nr:OmpW family outer membrane protein [Methylovorus menthalis]MCB4811238.1 outer membrane beta-barrel protein [Methylovorus menthalis]
MSHSALSHPLRLILGSLWLGLVVATPALAESDTAGPWQLRAGASFIVPTSDNGSIINHSAEVDIGNRVGPSFNIGYFITPHWALDLLGGLAFKHQIDVNGSRAGEAKHLPPILSLQYHFRPEATLRPFVGVGINYTRFLDEKLDSGDKLKLGSSWGPALQAGLDYALDDHWTVGADIRYARINSKVSINGNDVGDVDVNPFIYSVNVGYRF